MNAFFVDTHCHLDLFEGIQTTWKHEDELPIKTITVTNAPSFYPSNLTLFNSAKNIRVALGLHPELCLEYISEVSDFRNLISHTKYIGEIGLDGSPRFRNSFLNQANLFSKILENVVNEGGKILTIHSRNAAKEVVEMLSRQEVCLSNKVILHWYSGDKNTLYKAVEMGAYISINHKMLQSIKGLDILKAVPTGQLLTETDAPFTFDARIKNRLQSLELCHQLMATTLNIPQFTVQDIIYENFKRLLKF